MKRLLHLITSIILATLLSACVTVEVHENRKSSTSTDTGLLQGIPFFERKLVYFQETKIVKTGWRVRFSVSEEGDSKPRAFVPHSRPLAISCASTAALQAFSDKAIRASIGQTVEDAVAILNEHITELAELKDDASCETLLANVMKHEIRPGRTLYIRNKTPLFGSSSATFTFAADGTLASTSSSAQPLAEGSTLPDILPAKEFFTKQWKLFTVQTAALKSDTPTKKRILIALEAEPVRAIYTLRADRGESVLKNDTEISMPSIKEPLKIAASEGSSPSVQLISQQFEPVPAAPDPEAFQVKGTITPPSR